MIKHLIEFNGMQIALDRQEIIELQGAMEPFVVGIIQGMPDDQLPEFVTQFTKNIKEKRRMIKKRKAIPLEKKKEKVHYENNVYDFSKYSKRIQGEK